MELKEYQEGVLDKLDRYLEVLAQQREEAEDYEEFQRQKGRKVVPTNFAEQTWEQLNQERAGIPFMLDKKGNKHVAPYLSRYDGQDRSIPNVCLKVPTAGGKTLLATAALERIQADYFKQQTGMVLWVVPSDAIYRQTWKALANREHPYRQMLERASGGRVKMLEKNDAFTARDVQEYLCVMVLMLQSSSRKTKETLRMFRDSGNFTSFFPAEDDVPANEKLLQEIRNLDINDLGDADLLGMLPGTVSIKMSLGNVLRMVRPTIVIDEGHKAYSETSRDTLCGFNPKFILELSATPNNDGKHHSNVLVSVPGTALKNEEMVKLPIELCNDDKADWKHTLSVAHAKLEELQREAESFQTESGRYIRPIMLVRVERTGKEQRDNQFVHAEDAREYLLDHLGVKENEIRLKTSETDELADEDLTLDTCPVKYIITKDALREGWNCPFAYVLTVLSKMTANTAMTQMIGRILRQPDAELTHRQALDSCYVFTFDQDVEQAVESVKKGLEDEGMGDLAGEVRKVGGDGKDAPTMRKETLHLRDCFKSMPNVFLPQVLHRDNSEPSGYRIFDYERDILSQLDWESLEYTDAHTIQLNGDYLKRTVAHVGYNSDKPSDRQLGLIDQEVQEINESHFLDKPFLVRQLMEVIPNPWQGMRVLDDALDVLRGRGFNEDTLYNNRLDLLAWMKRHLRDQVHAMSEQLFREKLASGDIALKLLASPHEQLNWELAREVEITVSDDDKVLRRRDNGELERSLYDKVYQKGLNNLEKDTAWYLDTRESVYWWHRIAVNQREYSLQGWQKRKVYPDLLVCLKEAASGVYRFTLLETKGEHLKGNDDTVYKEKLFDVLNAYAQDAIEAGEFTLDSSTGAMSFHMLMEDNWKQELIKQAIT